MFDGANTSIREQIGNEIKDDLTFMTVGIPCFISLRHSSGLGSKAAISGANIRLRFKCTLSLLIRLFNFLSKLLSA